MTAHGAENLPRNADRRPEPTAALLAGALGVLNLAAFAAISALWHYLRTGRWLDLRGAAYHADLTNPLGEVSKVFFHPLNIFTHPWMIVIIGLLAAALILVPIAAAVLDRLLWAAAFLLVLAFIGHAPWLALVLAVACALAARTRLREEMPFAAMLLGILPAAVYLFGSVLAMSDAPSVLPLQQWVLLAPLVIATFTAALTAAGAGLLARLHRRLALLPLMLGMGGAAVWLFAATIGPDELAYALIAGEVSPDNRMLPDISLADWKARSGGEGLSPAALRTRVAEDLRYRKLLLTEQCDEFLRHFPRSRRAPEVLWIAGQLASLHVSQQALKNSLVSYDAAWTDPASRDDWWQLVDHFASWPQAGLAYWHLGVLDLRRGDIAGGLERLRQADQQIAAYLQSHPHAGQSDRAHQIFFPPATVPPREYYADVLLKVRRLIWLIRQNRLSEDAAAAQAFCDYLKLDPNALTRTEYIAKLAELAAAHEGTRFGDNLKLEYALASLGTLASPSDWDRNTIRMLVLLAKKDAQDSDAATEANFQLGKLVMQQRMLKLEDGVKEPHEYFEFVLAGPPNPYQDIARQRLELLKARGKYAL